MACPAPRFLAAVGVVLFSATAVFAAVSSAQDLGVLSGLVVGVTDFAMFLLFEVGVTKLTGFLARNDSRWQARVAQARQRRAARQHQSVSH
jgi:hypothetical protein